MSQQIKRASEVLQAIKRAEPQPAAPGSTLKNVGAVGAGGLLGAGINHLFGKLLYPDDHATQTYAAALGTVGGMGVGALARAQGVMKALPAGAGALVVEGLVGPHTAQARAATQASKAETAAALENAAASKAQAAAVGKLNAGEQLKTLWNDNPSVRGATAGLGVAGLGGLATGLSRAKTDEEIRQNASRAAMVRDDILKWLGPSLIGGAVIGGVAGDKKTANDPAVTGVMSPPASGGHYGGRYLPAAGTIGGGIAGGLFNHFLMAPLMGYPDGGKADVITTALGTGFGGVAGNRAAHGIRSARGVLPAVEGLLTNDPMKHKDLMVSGLAAEGIPLGIHTISKVQDVANRASGAMEGFGRPDEAVLGPVGATTAGALGGALLAGAAGAITGTMRAPTKREKSEQATRAKMIASDITTYLLPGLLLGGGAGYGLNRLDQATTAKK